METIIINNDCLSSDDIKWLHYLSDESELNTNTLCNVIVVNCLVLKVFKCIWNVDDILDYLNIKERYYLRY